VKIHSREIDDTDFEQMHTLLLKDGPNDWNYITEESIALQFQLIRNKQATAVLAEENGIHGFSVLVFKQACPAKLSKYDELCSIAYINDVVVSSDHSGKGIGSKLLQESINLARIEKCKRVYVERHEENLASAGMMRKAGFELVETFLDREKRSSGSRNTSILAIST